MIKPEQISNSWLDAETGFGASRRGLEYRHQGRARVVDIKEETIGQGTDLIIRGECRGSQVRPYTQEVVVSGFRGSLELEGYCTCPVGFNCKHVVALLLTWRDDAGQRRLDPLDRWFDRIEKNAQPDKGEQSLLYLLEPPNHDWQPVTVSFVVAQRKADGEWMKGRRTQPAALHDSWSSPAYMQPVDHEILPLLRISAVNYHGGGHPIQGANGALVLRKLIESGRAFWGEDRRGPITAGPAAELLLHWKQASDHFRLALESPDNTRVIGTDPPAWLDLTTLQCGPLELPAGISAGDLVTLREMPPVPESRALEVSRKLALRRPDWPRPIPVEIQHQQGPVRGVLIVDFDPRRPDQSRAQLRFDYDGHRFDTDRSRSERVLETATGLIRIERDPTQEDALIQVLGKHTLQRSPEQQGEFRLASTARGAALRDAWFAWLDHEARALEHAGWIIEVQSGWTRSAVEQIDGEVEEDDHGWFSLRFDLEVDGWRIPLVPLISGIIEDYDLNALPETLHLDISEEEGEPYFAVVASAQIRPILQTLMDLHDQFSDDRIALSRADAGLLGDLGPVPLHGASKLQRLARALRDFSGLQEVKLPTTFHGELRQYQQGGLNWLQFLRAHEFNGILADDMGLGKTIQTLAHLAVEKRAGRMQQPCLIVAPTSLMGNWCREAAQFTPKLRVLTLQGRERLDRFEQIGDHDLVLTTYPLLPRDREVLLAQHWHYLILDEAQAIKNPKAQAAQVARALRANHRLCLTGTPMENHLGELWAQFDFLMPGFLGDRTSFTRHYRTPIEKHQDQEALGRLHRRIAPFLLRRTKDRVASELPAKTEMIRTASFDPAQARLYESIRLVMEDKVARAIATRGLAKSHIIVLDALLKLRQVCCDPRLLPPHMQSARGVPSAKLNLLFELLPDLLEEGRRVLLFSQFTTLLGHIEEELRGRQIAYTKLTGQTRKREDAIERFRSGKVNLFLISLKAGGVGLNLTEADTVIHYDPWWNPAVEHQATDRAHRIGQDKPVFVYKLVAEGTVEEKILALQASKHALAQQVYGKGRAASDPPITEDTIAHLLGSGD
jgi:superfamily II DNA or RNA helicase